jgi:endonuclease III related protein
MNNFLRIYNLLYKAYGPQYWWPCSTKEKKFEMIIGSILTQNTSWKNVEIAIKNLNDNDLIASDKIIKADINNLKKLIKSAGYYNQKAERLKIVAKFFKENKSITREKLLKVNGIGPETADSILLYAYNKPYFVIDAYTKRIFNRLELAKTESYEELQKLFEANLPKEAQLFNEYHALIVKLAKEHCKKKPECGNCPLNKVCKKFSASC